jgi:hypothetical protein
VPALANATNLHSLFFWSFCVKRQRLRGPRFVLSSFLAEDQDEVVAETDAVVVVDNNPIPIEWRDVPDETEDKEEEKKEEGEDTSLWTKKVRQASLDGSAQLSA